jgi:hypothetical protein
VGMPAKTDIQNPHPTAWRQEEGPVVWPSEKCELDLRSAVLEASQWLRGLKKVRLVGQAKFRWPPE